MRNKINITKVAALAILTLAMLLSSGTAVHAGMVTINFTDYTGVKTPGVAVGNHYQSEGIVFGANAYASNNFGAYLANPAIYLISITMATRVLAFP